MMTSDPNILFVLPLAFQDGVDKYNGIMRYLREHNLHWNIRLDRHSTCIGQPTIGEKDSFDAAIIDGDSRPGLQRAYVETTGIPLVAIDWRHAEIGQGRPHFVRIRSDNAQIGRIAARELLKNGSFASYVFLPLTKDTIWSIERGEAFVRTLRRRKIEALVLDPTEDLLAQLRALPKPAALFAACDTVAERVIRACACAKIPVPGDLSVLGVDNEQLICIHTRPSLASIQPNFERAGYMAAEALHRMLSGKSVRADFVYRVKSIAPRGSLQPARSAGRLVQRALELIRDPHATFENINGLARQLGVSRRLLDLRFREITSKSVLDAVRDVRFERVCTLLKTTNLEITEICATSGMGHGSYPSRAFHKRFGMSMQDYRRALQREIGERPIVTSTRG